MARRARDGPWVRARGDRITHDLVSQLERSFLLPFDREDGHGLASVIDDLLDYIDEAAEHLVIYKIDAASDHAVTLAGLVRDATRELASETLMLGQPSGSGQAPNESRSSSTKPTAYRPLVGFDRETDPLVVLRWKDIIQRLENAIDSGNHAAWVLEGIRIKNGL
jgi:uncharacterized protein Yka (UPF0111/DUF47 family)